MARVDGAGSWAEVLILNSKLIFVPAKKQPWSSSLCHSLVPHTNVDL